MEIYPLKDREVEILDRGKKLKRERERFHTIVIKFGNQKKDWGGGILGLHLSMEFNVEKIR